METGLAYVCQNLLLPKLFSGINWHLAQNFKNVLCVSSFVDRSVATSPVTHYHIFVNIINPITLAGLLETQQSILEAEKAGGVVHGFLSRTKYRKQNVNRVVIIYSLCILGAFSHQGEKRIMIMFPEP